MTTSTFRRMRMGLMMTTLLAFVSLGAAKEKSPVDTHGLRHAVVCPPFKGEQPLATLYHDEMVDVLKSAGDMEYLEGARSAANRVPDFTYRVNGAIIQDDNGDHFVTVAVVDVARREEIASHISPASTNAGRVAAWRQSIQRDMERRMAKIPFECRLRHSKHGENSVTLDRGLGSGLQPGMVLYVSRDEAPLVSPETGAIVGRDVARSVGRIEVYRVMDDTAYARPVEGATLPKRARLFAFEF
ncbi:MAG: hypothetical protein LBN38_06115 [Verrucomicrobiota bacterium]|nr:hypothetical protein [Verrucomicrobiota bacterium]